MNNTFSLEQLSKKSSLDNIFILGQYKVDLMAMLWRSNLSTQNWKNLK